MPGIDVSKVLSTVVPEGVTPKEHYEQLYVQIGNHLIKNASILSGDVNDYTSSVTININLEPNEIVTIDKFATQIVIGD